MIFYRVVKVLYLKWEVYISALKHYKKMKFRVASSDDNKENFKFREQTVAVNDNRSVPSFINFIIMF